MTSYRARRPSPARSDHDDFGGLDRDLTRLLDRRRALGLLGALGATAVVSACGAGDNSAAVSNVTSPSTSGGSTTSVSGSGSTVAGSCAVIPEETAGPYPGDGTNGPNVLTESGVVRKDITRSFGDASGIAAGVPLTIRFRLTDTANGCRSFAGAAVYAWHCTREGGYSMYSDGLESENFLRGVQVSGEDGVVEFASIFPGCYSGRWPHIHFEVYRTLDAATAQSGHIAVSQIAIPKDPCDVVYATTGYEASVRNMAAVSLSSDNVFSDDGAAHQLGTVTGDLSSMVVELAVAVDSSATPTMGGGGGGGGAGRGGGPGGPPPDV